MLMRCAPARTLAALEKPEFALRLAHGVADDLCVINSMPTEGVAHGPATLFLHTGSSNFVRPSMGSWLLYGLGSENRNLPGFVSIGPSLGNGGPRNHGSAFLPAIHQGTAIGRATVPARELAFGNLVPGRSLEHARQQFELQQALNTAQVAGAPESDLTAVVESYELAWRMQNEAPGVVDLARETPAFQRLISDLKVEAEYALARANLARLLKEREGKK